MDTTCYESEMLNSTDQKLLWKGKEKAKVIMCSLSTNLNLQHPRMKSVDVEKTNLSVQEETQAYESPDKYDDQMPAAQPTLENLKETQD